MTLIVAVIAAISTLSAPSAHGQTCNSGWSCVMGTETTTVGCPAPCTTVKLTEPSGGGYGSGTCYQNTYPDCCALYFSLGDSGGSCEVGQSPQLARKLVKALGGDVPMQEVWVRGCTGRYSLLKLPISG